MFLQGKDDDLKWGIFDRGIARVAGLYLGVRQLKRRTPVANASAVTGGCRHG